MRCPRLSRLRVIKWISASIIPFIAPNIVVHSTLLNAYAGIRGRLHNVTGGPAPSVKEWNGIKHAKPAE